MAILSAIPQYDLFALVISYLLGWSYFLCWSISFYPQLLANHQRQSVTGLAVDFFTVNVLGYICYTISSFLFLFSSTVRDEYARRHPGAEEPTVRWNDLAFATHALLISSITLSQFYFWGYKRDESQRMSRTMSAIAISCVTAITISVLLALNNSNWELIDVVYTLQYVKLLISIVKYIPQAYLNYQRKATTGWSIHNILLDISGGTLSLGQLVLDSSLQSDWSGLTGNPIKFFLGQISIIFDILFIIQHYILYRHAGAPQSAFNSIERGYSSISTSQLLPSASSSLDKNRQVPRGGAAQHEERRGLLGSNTGETINEEPNVGI
ncbi:PQ loop repeat-domain-containing protein [Morchella snyderi]|nr:PQ loop repeat-domain-containing protein [Morchella snyderi]